MQKKKIRIPDVVASRALFFADVTQTFFPKYPASERLQRRRRHLVDGGVIALVALLMGLSTTAFAGSIPTAQGWNLQWGDDFSGPAGSPPSSDNWRIDLGHSYPNGPANWGTNEIESYTADASNLHLDGQGHLLMIPLRDANGQWTSGRIETTRDNFMAPDGGALRITASTVRGRTLASSTSWRTSTDWIMSGAFFTAVRTRVAHAVNPSVSAAICRARMRRARCPSIRTHLSGIAASRPSVFAGSSMVSWSTRWAKISFPPARGAS
jgi:hypothetical protein